MWDLTVPGNGDHDFYVTAGSVSILVHNNDGECGITPSDLSGSTASNYNRYLKSLPSGAEEPTITQLPDGNVQFDANVPARNIPGSYATYTKVVDPEGRTVTFYKTTYAPDGSVVHVKVKYP